LRSRRYCLPVVSTRSAPELRFEAQFPARRCLCPRFTRLLAAPGARLEVKMVRYSFLWGSFIPDYTPVYPDDCACLRARLVGVIPALPRIYHFPCRTPCAQNLQNQASFSTTDLLLRRRTIGAAVGNGTCFAEPDGYSLDFPTPGRHRKKRFPSRERHRAAATPRLSNESPLPVRAARGSCIPPYRPTLPRSS